MTQAEKKDNFIYIIIKKNTRLFTAISASLCQPQTGCERLDK